MCTQMGKKKILGGGTIDSLFKRPLTLHTLLPKEAHPPPHPQLRAHLTSTV